MKLGRMFCYCKCGNVDIYINQHGVRNFHFGKSDGIIYICKACNLASQVSVT